MQREGTWVEKKRKEWGAALFHFHPFPPFTFTLFSIRSSPRVKHFPLLFSLAALLTPLSAATPDSFPLVTERVQSYVDRGYYPGCGVWIAQGDKVLYEKCFGRFRPDTEVYIASAGKWLVSATILSLVDEKKLSLNDPVEKWLPEFRGDPKGKATLRQLLSHTSGFPPYQPEGNPKDDYQTTAESVAHLLPLPLHYPAGSHFEYGGLGMQVAGRMAEVATGENWEAIFLKRIARPLGMTRTRFSPVDPEHIPMLAGGAVSTLSDYSRFLTMIADGGVFAGRKILSPMAIAEMEFDQVKGAAVHREEFVERRRGHTHHGIYGLGVWREELDANGNTVVLSSPSWAGTYPWIDRKHNIRGLIIAHQDGATAGPAHFSGFWRSPVLMNLVRAQYEWKPPQSLPGYQAGTIRLPDGHDLSYEASGSGEPMVLLHGHSFDRRMWDPQIAELAKHYRVIRYDLRGYGLSDLPDEGRDFLHAEDLTAVLDYLKIPKAHVVGLSLGGYVVGDMVALHPDRLLSATIASGGVFDGTASRDLSPQQREEQLAVVEKVRVEGIDALKKNWQEALLQGTGPRADSVRPMLSAMIGDWSAWQPLHVEPHSLLGHEAITKIESAKPQVPVLWIAGANDRYQDSVAKFRAVLPDMEVVILPDAGHLSNLEQPQAFTDTLLAFLKKHSK